MAKLISNIVILGTIDGITYYKLPGSPQIYARSARGHSARRLKTDPSFGNFRRAGHEFGGRSTTASALRNSMSSLKSLFDNNLQAKLIKLLQPIQVLDGESDWGQRNVHISKSPGLLEGYNLSHGDSFDSFIRNPCRFHISRPDLSAAIDIPPLLPGINFMLKGKYPMFSILAELGVVPDFSFTPGGYRPSSTAYDNLRTAVATTEWFPCSGKTPPVSLELQLPAGLPDESCSMVLSLGICFGSIGPDKNVQQIPRAGAAKILGVV